jgi:6-pyruvoyltetrahydropterin/6-carboxytetrahydropterin synthase
VSDVAFEVGASASLRAFHRLPWMTGPEAEPHAHEYRIEVTVQRPELDERGMVCDLDVLQAALGEVLGRLADRDLDELSPDEVEAVTVEVLARWLHAELRDTARAAGAQTLAVRVWESPDAFGGYRAAVG